MWTVLNFLFFLQKDFARTKMHQKEKKHQKTKSTKSTKKHNNATKQKYKTQISKQK